MTNPKPYNPNPIKISEQELPAGIRNCIDEMARNVHEQWAQGRMLEGWTYGKTRNDDRKEHPTLVPYDELPESEKEYDRNTTKAVLAYILSQGFKITQQP